MSKYLLKLINSIPLLVAVYLVSLTVSTLLFSYYEGYTIFESFYWSSVTSLTIGYGDISPVTAQGKLLTILLGHFWVFVITPCVVANILTKVIIDHDQFTHQEQEELKEKLNELLNKNNQKGF
jgi:hypothetical protein